MRPRSHAIRRRLAHCLVTSMASVVLLTLPSAAHAAEKPSILLLTIDALRADRLSCYGYQRPTSPNIDELLGSGTRFSHAWTVEPLTNPALTSLLTSTGPEVHGASRNGLRMRPDLSSLPTVLHENGWMTAAFVSNWTLKNKLSRLGDHFEHYEGIFTNKRGFFLTKESSAGDVVDRALAWLDANREQTPKRPFFLWIHLSDPHAPYDYQKESGRALGLTRRSAEPTDRYDTEVHAVDREVEHLLTALRTRVGPAGLLVAFSADHGESLGEHGYWGHGRHLFEPTLRIPMGLAWQDRIASRVIDEPALIIDLAPTVLDLVDIAKPQQFKGTSWSKALSGGQQQTHRSLCFQAHKGAVDGDHDSQKARSRGLLEVATIAGPRKEILRLRGMDRLLFDFEADPREITDLAQKNDANSTELMNCLGAVASGLESLDRLAVTGLDDESREQLRALGYLE
jgi:choline-sulfatase